MWFRAGDRGAQLRRSLPCHIPVAVTGLAVTVEEAGFLVRRSELACNADRGRYLACRTDLIGSCSNLDGLQERLSCLVRAASCS
jgi:hypothetical protein